MLKFIDELGVEELKGKHVLLRLDLNVPIIDGHVADTFRLDRVIETIDFLREKEAKVIIISHIESGEKTLVPVWHYLNGFVPVDFCPTYFTPGAIDKLLNLKDKGVLMFENLRVNPGEKANDSEFAKKLSGMAEIYVNDAFAVSHRKHASIVGVPEFLPHYGGPLLKQEIEHLSKVFNPERPFLFILGGAKFDTKMPLIEKYLEKADKVFLVGALANNLYKARGFEVGTSLVSLTKSSIKEIADNKKIVTPVDVTVTNSKGEVSFKKVGEIEKDECIVDVGPEAIDQLKKLLEESKTILWNGPLGNYELGFVDKTEALATMAADVTTSEVTTIVGGGDTIASINKLGLNDKFTFISTGGGAMLDFLVNETLPGIDALE
ncbi:MAG: Phosphoglycerate kinase [Parcubacteria group bacterium Gr01-1014_46]|nr:MAG: Phosphoglycerate kinase [Parcubacteria group bacterium Gr01-1014_46]